MSAVIVLDNGSGYLKAGFSSEAEPRCSLNTAVGRPTAKALSIRAGKGYIGIDAQSRRAILSLHHPIKRGVIVNWDDMEHIWHHVFHQELSTNPDKHDVIITEAPNCSLSQRENMVEIMFEKFSVGGIFVAIPGTLSLFDGNRDSALLVEFGEGGVHVVPMFEGYVLTDAITSTQKTGAKLAGEDLTRAMREMLIARGYSIPAELEMDSAQDIKEKLCFVANDYDAEAQAALKNKQLPASYEIGNQRLRVDIERFMCPEIMFRPSLVGLKTTESIQEMIFNTVMNCPVDTRKSLYENVVVSGGGSAFPGFIERLQKELTAGSGWSFKVAESPNSRHAAWHGGACLGSLPFFQELTLTKRQYLEYGSVAVHRGMGSLK